ncbi:MAG: hypothetical protein SV186_04975 [Candidatus Nanohaloarchaea archaeon]|nr:hypothetical protein [Candidatus Nanohaloarchaea archaeon]
MVDPVEINTGVGGFTSDYTWNIAEFGLGVHGGSVDVGGELLYFDLVPTAYGHDFTDSPVDVSTVSLLRRILRAASQPTTDTTTDGTHQAPDKQQRSQRGGSRPHQQQERTQRAPRHTPSPPRDRYNTEPAANDWSRQDRGLTWDEPLASDLGLNSVDEEQRGDRLQSRSNDGVAASASERFTAATDDPAAREHDLPDGAIPAVDERVENMQRRLEEELAAVGIDPLQQERKQPWEPQTGTTTGDSEPAVAAPHLTPADNGGGKSQSQQSTHSPDPGLSTSWGASDAASSLFDPEWGSETGFPAEADARDVGLLPAAEPVDEARGFNGFGEGADDIEATALGGGGFAASEGESMLPGMDAMQEDAWPESDTWL